MRQGQITRMQMQPRRHGLHRRWGVQSVAQDRVAQGLQVQTQLVAAPGQRLQLQAAGLAL